MGIAVRIVLDTNVLVSGMLSALGPSGQIVELMIDGALQPCIDGRIIEEYESVLRRPRLAIPPADADDILVLIRRVAEPIAARPLAASLPDPDDLPFLEVAATARAVLITGNLRHFPEEACAGVTVVSPRQFLDLLRQPP